MKQLYEHYFRGETYIFDKSIFMPVKNTLYAHKPRGGFWASRVDAQLGWKEWCNAERESWAEGTPFIFSLKDNAKVLYIKKNKDMELMESFLFNNPLLFGNRSINFEQMARTYDALEVDAGSSVNCPDFYSWDCDSILIFNPEIIEERSNGH